MGKMLIYSKQYKNAEKMFSEFSVSHSHSYADMNIVTYSKLNINTENYYEKNNNWIAGVGTFVYDSKIDREALKGMMQYVTEHCQDNILDVLNAIRFRILGNYCIALFINGVLYVFVDTQGAYKMYYHNENNNFILTNTWYHIGRLINTPKNINHREFVEFFCKTDIMCNKTPIKNIYRLDEFSCLIYENQEWRIQRIEYPLETIDQDFWDAMKTAYSQIYKAIPHQGIFFTGGIDSRINLAMHLGVGGKPVLYYGVGDSRKTNTKLLDKQCFETAADIFSLENHIMNWKDTDISKIDAKIDMLGEYAIIYAGNDNIYNEFRSKIKVSSISFGYFGEYLRNNEFDESGFFTIDDYLRKHYEVMVMQYAYRYNSEYYEMLKKTIGSILCIYKLNPQHLTPDDITILNYHIRKNWDARMSNYANMFMYSYMLVPNYSLMKKAFSVSYQEKNHCHFTLEGLNRVFAKSLDFPIFSHHSLRVIDRKKLEITYSQKRTELIRNKLQKYYIKLRDTPIRNIYFLLKKDKKGLREMKSERETKEKLKYLVNNRIVVHNFNPSKMYKACDTGILESLMINLKLIGYYYETEK